MVKFWYIRENRKEQFMSDPERPEAGEGQEGGEQQPEIINVEEADVERLSQDKGLVGFALGAALFEDSLHQTEGEPESGRVVGLFRALYQGEPYEEAIKIHPNAPKDFKYYVSLVAGEYFGSEENYRNGTASDKYATFFRHGNIVREGTVYNFERWSRNVAQTKITGARGLIALYEKAWEKADLRARGIDRQGKDGEREAA